MDPIRLGRAIRHLRRRRGWTQARLGSAAGLSRETVSRVETGEVGSLRIDTLVRLAAAMDVGVDIGLRWRGEALDRLLDEAHANLVERVVEMLAAVGWETAVEVTFSRYGERGAIDVLARHPAAGSVLAVEVKSVVPDLQAMLAGLDRKARLARFVVEERGWDRPTTISRLVVLPAGRTVQRRLATHRSTLASALPDRGASVRAWMRRPEGRSIAGILLVPCSRETTARRPRSRAPGERTVGSATPARMA
jgi:transcriptional regulator with XRE-family HTH domain